MSAETHFQPVMGELLTRVMGDAATLALLDGSAHVYERESMDALDHVPAIYWSATSSVFLENYERWLIRWDIWAANDATVWQLEARLRDLLHFEIATTIAGKVCKSHIMGSSALGGSERGTYRRVLEHRLEIFRHRRQ